MSGFSNKPKILRGAFVEYGLSIPPLFVVFQFNPVELGRSRSISFSPPNEGAGGADGTDGGGGKSKELSLRDFHKRYSLKEVQKNQQVTVEEESIKFDIRLDATDNMNDGGLIARKFGIAPELSALEMMVHPKEESILGSFLGPPGGYSFTRGANPPMVLFIWGIKRVLPVNINSLDIKETEFSTWLNPIRAEVGVSLTVVEGKNAPYKYSKVMKEAMAVLNLANIAKIATIAIPG